MVLLVELQLLGVGDGALERTVAGMDVDGLVEKEEVGQDGFGRFRVRLELRGFEEVDAVDAAQHDGAVGEAQAGIFLELVGAEAVARGVVLEVLRQVVVGEESPVGGNPDDVILLDEMEDEGIVEGIVGHGCEVARVGVIAPEAVLHGAEIDGRPAWEHGGDVVADDGGGVAVVVQKMFPLSALPLIAVQSAIEGGHPDVSVAVFGKAVDASLDVGDAAEFMFQGVELVDALQGAHPKGGVVIFEERIDRTVELVGMGVVPRKVLKLPLGEVHHVHTVVEHADVEGLPVEEDVVHIVVGGADVRL